MNSITQRAIGTGNIQTTQIFNRPLDFVDICADKISSVLKTIAGIDFSQVADPGLIPPKINIKNEKNNIDSANSVEIETTYALWAELTSSIASDASGAIASDYAKSAFILNQLYLAKFRGDFPGFKLHAITIYCENTSAGPDEAYLLIHLVHYMYLSCHLGVRP